jgi:hypothetical protein
MAAQIHIRPGFAGLPKVTDLRPSAAAATQMGGRARTGGMEVNRRTLAERWKGC